MATETNKGTGKSGETPRQRSLKRKQALWTERSSWMTHWRELSENLLPRNGRFITSDTNKGDKRHNRIYDSTGTRSLRILAAGLMAGMTSPARPWFRLATNDTGLMEVDSVKLWLNEVTKMMRDVFAQSNTYNALHMVYEELGTFGTGVSVIVPDFDNIIHHYPLTIGEYAIATDNRNRVSTLYREIPMTVAQIVQEWGLNKVSASIKNQYDHGNFDQWLTIIHGIEPRIDRDPRKRDNKNMAFKSIYFEAAGNGSELLGEGGFKDFPALAARWLVAGGDIYGNSPGMEALGDIKQLQHEQLRKSQVIDYQTKPPLQMPTSMSNMQINSLPGGSAFVDTSSPSGGIKTQFEVNLNLQHLLLDIQDVRERIRGAFYADLFLMMANDRRNGITATEVAELHEEKLLMLGPVLERLHNELLNPLIDIAFARLVEAKVLPPPPPELQGRELKVEFVSTLAQAQRAVGVGAVDRLLGVVGGIAALKPAVLDKLNEDQIVDAYADMLGVDPNLIVADDKVVLIRESRAQQAKAMEQMAQQQAMVQTAQTASQIDTEGKNGLTDVLQQFQGYTVPG